ncbi:D-alanyl-D-alanine carboxypeptidase / D-alanyl-D-alanine-endopeptidase (penicillin-binding protein 4) [Maribacter sedimenticola]|uniref:D-alanyl-D-alanine carboxypeptidase / D-alanyl-D-alanine-endopeptidase (Penicillin-binding protein 4) n=1 Tax=Maribacter sedimenticola TaxID=228956 RepID=A0ABY1SFF6_9FLAO|nr:D-alanyl-D-alanine carboxypeptidase [Maribacter sedimenticola]SNR41711.1 D-alanyl-D-alanine carboxypeptidase / D-alanyl-D-alanine-endopeptidase (penicillin-binding protein 4) [Maribacter sedimenticola]
MKNLLYILLVTLTFTACRSSRALLTKQLDNKLSTPFYKNQFTGILVIDAETKDTIYDRESDKYFIPASNTKIFTLYTAIKTIPDHIPALKYIESNDTLYFEGTGDPSFLHPYLKDSTAFTFLKSKTNLVYVTDNFQDKKYGPGWAWDDYQWYYSPEKNALPLYGNVVMINTNQGIQVTPPYFKDSVLNMNHTDQRKETSNLFFYPTQGRDTLEIPFITSTATTRSILENTLNQKITTRPRMPKGTKKTLRGINADSLYIRMMHESDNFIAEQLLILAASELKDTLSSAMARTYILENQLADLGQSPRWVDGSGLSRYNLFTPQNMVEVLNKLYIDLPRERLYTIFPAGGLSGTLKNRFAGNQKPYIYAKSGSLSNTYCLSGYLITNSGKTLIFSVMNNHFRNSTSDERTHLEAMLQMLRDHY